MSILTDKKSWVLKINNKSLLEDYYFSDLRLVQEISRPNELHLCLQKISQAETKEDLMFKKSQEWLGKEVEIAFKTIGGTIETDNEKNEDVQFNFRGIVSHVDLSRSSMGNSLAYQVTAYSPDFILMDNPHCFSYESKSLKDIVSETIKDGDISIENDPAFTDEILYTVQYNESNYDFLSRLAIRFGEWFYYNGEKMVFGKVKKLDTLELLPTRDILSYNYRLMVNHLNYSHHRHNYLTYENLKKSASDFLTSDPKHGMTKMALSTSKDLYKKETFQNLNAEIAEANNFDEIEISAKIQALGKQAQLMVCSGTSNRADLKLGTQFSLKEDFQDEKNAGTDDSDSLEHDELMIINISHYLNNQGYYENSFTAIPAETEVPPYNYGETFPSMLPQRAVVKENQDPEKLGRVRVQFLWQKEQDEELMTPWVRIAQPHGGKNKGFYFIPEIEEEVMVGFENGNAEKPYVIGTLYQGEQKPGENWYNDDNNIKAIRTRSGHTIEINDADDGGFIKIYDLDKDNYILTFSTDDKLIKLESKGNIELYAENDIIMEAKNNINIKAEADMTINVDGDRITEVKGKDALTVSGDNENTIKGKMKIEATGDYNLEAMNVKQKSKAALNLEAGSTAELKASASGTVDGGGSLTLKGGTTSIN